MKLKNHKHPDYKKALNYVLYKLENKYFASYDVGLNDMDLERRTPPTMIRELEKEVSAELVRYGFEPPRKLRLKVS